MPAKATIAAAVSAKTWILLILGIGMASCAALVAVVGPRVARGIVAPISRMKTEQQEFERWTLQRAWQEPASPQLEPAKLDAFLALRKELLELDARGEGIGRDMPRDRRPSLGEIGGLMEGVGGLVTGQLAAHRRHDITPKEYAYLRRLVYRQWLEPLKAQGLDPAARLAAAKELDAAAEAERDPALQKRLRQVARGVRERRPPAPEAIPQPVHELLFAKATEIQSLGEREPRFRSR